MSGMLDQLVINQNICKYFQSIPNFFKCFLTNISYIIASAPLLLCADDVIAVLLLLLLLFLKDIGIWNYNNNGITILQYNALYRVFFIECHLQRTKLLEQDCFP